MNALIEKRFERVEKDEAIFITSMSTGNPIIAQAQDIVKSDAELNQALDQGWHSYEFFLMLC